MGNWTNNMKHFLIITNAFKDKNLKLTNEIKEYIVTSESGQPQTYDIRVERASASAENEIKNFRIGTINGEIEGDLIKIKLSSNINL